MKAIPIRSGKKVSRNTNLDIIGENESILVQMKDEKKRIEEESDMVNAFNVDKMGIGNVDTLMNSDDIIWSNIGFNFSDKFDLNINKIVIYPMFINEKSVIRYLPKDWKKVRFKKNSVVKKRAVLPGGKVVEVESDQIKAKPKSSRKVIFSTKEIK